MALNLSVPDNTELKPRITVFGVGGAGGNAVDNMIEKQLEGAEFVVANTDAQALQQSTAPTKLQLGIKVTEGLGAGAKPEIGAHAAAESIEEIVDRLAGSHMCFITAGMGGGTGTGAAPVIAKAAREMGVLTINLDFADIRSVMDEMGKAMMGTGEGTGENRAIEAAEKAIANPLLDEISLKGARGVLINITGSHDLTLFELDEAANRIRAEVDPEANIIVGSTLDDSCEGMMRVSVVATGIDASDVAQEPPTPRRTVADVVAAEQAAKRSEPETHGMVAPAPKAEATPEPAPSFTHTPPPVQEMQEPEVETQFAPAPRRVETTDAVKQRLQEAVSKMPESAPVATAAAAAGAEGGGRFAINSLMSQIRLWSRKSAIRPTFQRFCADRRINA